MLIALLRTQHKVADSKGSQTQEFTQTQTGRQTQKHISMQQHSGPCIVAVFVQLETAPTSINKAMLLQICLAAVVCFNSVHYHAGTGFRVDVQVILLKAAACTLMYWLSCSQEFAVGCMLSS